MSWLLLLCSSVSQLAVLESSPKDSVDWSAFSSSPKDVHARIVNNVEELDWSAFSPQPMTFTAPQLDWSAFDCDPVVRVPPPQEQSSKVRWGYPLRNSIWTFPGKTRGDLINHLISDSHHMKYQLDKLELMSFQELLSIHADDHENALKPLVVIEEPPQPKASGSHLAPATIKGNDGKTYYRGDDGIYRQTPAQSQSWTVPIGAPKSVNPFSSLLLNRCPTGYCPQ
jgi:hypothetical protein